MKRLTETLRASLAEDADGAAVLLIRNDWELGTLPAGLAGRDLRRGARAALASRGIRPAARCSPLCPCGERSG
jgi:hypothetical protein